MFLRSTVILNIRKSGHFESIKACRTQMYKKTQFCAFTLKQKQAHCYQADEPNIWVLRNHLNMLLQWKHSNESSAVSVSPEQFWLDMTCLNNGTCSGRFVQCIMGFQFRNQRSITAIWWYQHVMLCQSHWWRLHANMAVCGHHYAN